MERTFRNFVKESPDYNFILPEGNIEKIAANRAILAIMTEFGLMNDRKMIKRELLSFLDSIQITTGDFVIVKDILDIQKSCMRIEDFVVKPFTLVQTGETAIEGMA